jgi:hypothetical protein
MAVSASTSNILGLHVRLVLTNDVVKEGLIYAYEPNLGIVVLQSPSSSASSTPNPPSSSTAATNGSVVSSNSSTIGKNDFHIIKVGFIKEATQTSNNALIHLDDCGAVIESESSESSSTNGKTTVPEGYKDLVQIGHVPMEKLNAKFYNAVKTEHERLAKIGVGVSETAQVCTLMMLIYLKEE